MALSDQLRLVDCGEAELADAQALSGAAGWNQTADDWRLFMRHGKTIGYRNAAGQLVATAAALPYGNAKGWVAMVLVTEAWRHQGLATRLLHICIDHLRARGVTPYLDATPAGAPTYRKAGFQSGFALSRWEGMTSQCGQPLPAPMRAAVHDDLGWIIGLDAAANGIRRDFLLQDFLARNDSCAWVMRDQSGFVIRRQGRRATQIGPLVANDESAAIALLNSALDLADAAVFLDLPDRWHSLAALLRERGFAVQRSFVRMALGAIAPPAANDALFVLAGPEFG